MEMLSTFFALFPLPVLFPWFFYYTEQVPYLWHTEVDVFSYCISLFSLNKFQWVLFYLHHFGVQSIPIVRSIMGKCSFLRNILDPELGGSPSAGVPALPWALHDSWALGSPVEQPLHPRAAPSQATPALSIVTTAAVAEKVCWEVSHNNGFKISSTRQLCQELKVFFSKQMTNKPVEAAKNTYLYKLALMLPV